jgi:hypothetical protein
MSRNLDEGLKLRRRGADGKAIFHPTNRRGGVSAAFLQVRSIPIPRLGPLTRRAGAF